MAEFDESKITTDPTGAAGNVTVRYDGEYAGVVIPDVGRYRCAVHMQRNAEWILQRFGVSESIDDAGKAVAYQYWLQNHYVDASPPMRDP